MSDDMLLNSTAETKAYSKGIAEIKLAKLIQKYSGNKDGK